MGFVEVKKLMNFRKSTFNDVDRILEIIEKAKIELKKLGLDQWQNGYPNREVIENDVKNRISYVLEEISEKDDKSKNQSSKKIIGTIVLSPKKEEPYSKIEGKWITNDDYIVIHRLAVDSEIKNKGIATKILEFSEKECIKN